MSLLAQPHSMLATYSRKPSIPMGATINHAAHRPQPSTEPAACGGTWELRAASTRLLSACLGRGHGTWELPFIRVSCPGVSSQCKNHASHFSGMLKPWQRGWSWSRCPGTRSDGPHARAAELSSRHPGSLHPQTCCIHSVYAGCHCGE